MNDDVQDLADQAEAAEQRFRDAALSYRKPTLVPCGQCHWCAEPLNKTLLFCCIECSQDWQREHDIRARQGV